MRLNEALTLLRDRLKAEGKGDHTIRAYCSDVRKYVFWSEPSGWDPELAELPPVVWGERNTIMIHYINETRDTASPATTNRRMSSLRAMTKTLGYPNPFESYRGPTVGKGRAHPLPEGTDDLLAMVAAAVGPEQRCLLGLCGAVGLRVSEARTVRPLDFTHPKPNTTTLTVRGKGDKQRTVPVSAFAWTLIEPMINLQEHPHQLLLRISDRWARTLITQMGDRAGVSRPVASHDLRMTFGSAVYNSTKDIRVTQELLGHANSKTTEGYTGVREAAMADAVEGIWS